MPLETILRVQPYSQGKIRQRFLKGIHRERLSTAIETILRIEGFQSKRPGKTGMRLAKIRVKVSLSQLHPFRMILWSYPKFGFQFFFHTHDCFLPLLSDPEANFVKTKQPAHTIKKYA